MRNMTIGAERIKKTRNLFLEIRFMKLLQNSFVLSILTDIDCYSIHAAYMKQLLSKPFLRYVFVGGISFLADYGTFLLCAKVLHTQLYIAVPVSLIVGLIVNFILNKVWTFGHQSGSTAKGTFIQIAKYGVLLIINSVFSYYFIKLAYTGFGIDESITKIIANVLIVGWNYLIYQKIIFVGTKGE